MKQIAQFIPVCLVLIFIPELLRAQAVPIPIASPEELRITSFLLSTEMVRLPCPGAAPASGGCGTDRTIEVTVTTSAARDLVNLNYRVSAGRIVGSGSKVVWDLSGASPGTYTITVDAVLTDGSQTVSRPRTIEVRACPDCSRPCSCGELSVAGPSGLSTPGSSITFTAGPIAGVTYSWSVSGGTITSGQGTPSISVDTGRELQGRTITATVTIGRTHPACGCPTEASASALIASIPQAGYMFGEIRGRVLRTGSGRPLRGALVELIYEGTARVTTLTDNNGRYKFESVPAPVPFTIRVSKNGKHGTTTVITEMDGVRSAPVVRLNTQ